VSTPDLDVRVLEKDLSLSLFRSPIKIILLCLLLYAAFATKYAIFDAQLFMTGCKNMFSRSHRTMTFVRDQMWHGRMCIKNGSERVIPNVLFLRIIHIINLHQSTFRKCIK
jgi:hypothetical protein